MRAIVVTVLAILGVAAIVAGVVYLVVPAHSLPHFMPGYVAGASGKRLRHGYAALAAGGVLIIIAIAVGMIGKPKRHGSLR